MIKVNNIIITDNNNNYYGIVEVGSGYNIIGVKSRLRDIIKDLVKTDTEFFENFEVTLCNALEIFEKECWEKFGKECYVKLQVFDIDSFNVDEVFTIEDDIKVNNVEYVENDVVEVVDNITNMINNNIETGTDSIGEHFVDWCENGNIFNNENKKYVMEMLSADVDKLTNTIYELLDNAKTI